MASSLPLTVQKISDLIHNSYEQATDTPTLTDEDGKIRINLINKGIRRWQKENGVRWRELEVLNATGPTILLSTVSYALPQTDFKELSSKIRILRTDGSYAYVNMVSNEYYRNYMNSSGQVTGYNSTLVATITGNLRIGFTLNLGWIPKASDGTVGGIVYFDYYKYAETMTAMTDIPELSDPDFLVNYGVAELFVSDDINLYTKFMSDATNDLANMREANEKLPPFASNAVENQGTADSIIMGC